MIPVENSIAGRVADIHHLLPESGLHIVGEHFVPIHFQLMALPGDAAGARCGRVRSHAHALGQCRRILREHGWNAVVADDTAGAAREVARAGDPTRRGARPAARRRALRARDPGARTSRTSTTTPPGSWCWPASRASPRSATGRSITTFVFRVRNVPAALYKAMGGFATNGVNMTKLESYQLGGTFFATQFYADVEGHPKDASLALALEELAFFSMHLRILGTYPASPFRAEIAEPAANRELRPQAP